MYDLSCRCSEGTFDRLRQLREEEEGEGEKERDGGVEGEGERLQRSRDVKGLEVMGGRGMGRRLWEKGVKRGGREEEGGE